MCLRQYPGKTVLASMIVEEARKVKLATVTFFYCRYMDPERNTSVSVARGLLSQLLLQNTTILPYIYDAASRSGEATLTAPSLAEDLLETALKTCDRVYIILDGIDECEREKRQEISAVFKRIVESLPTENFDNVRCLFIS